MAKGRTLNLWDIAYVFAVAEGLSFDIDTILTQIVEVMMGTRAASTISAQLMTEVYDVVNAIKTDPAGTAIQCGINVGGVYLSRKVLSTLFSALGVPKSKKMGGITVRWA
jgi:hypothetical protein